MNILSIINKALLASSVHSLQNLITNPLYLDHCRDLGFAETLAANVDPMQLCHLFTIVFFLQPRGCLSPCPYTKVAPPNGSKFKHLNLSS